LTLTIGGLEYHIPQELYTKEISQQCHIMLEINDEANLAKDDIKTKDGLDYKTNNGYILGTPFIHAFHIILDFESNRVGFANKLRGFGQAITGEGAPGPSS
jgi:hypothetical protein